VGPISRSGPASPVTNLGVRRDPRVQDQGSGGRTHSPLRLTATAIRRSRAAPKGEAGGDLMLSLTSQLVADRR